MKFYISIEEVRSTVVEVEADNESEAINKVENAYGEDEVCLDSPEYIDDGTCFYNETDKWEECIKNGYATKFQKISK